MRTFIGDKLRKQIIAAYIECGNYRAVGRRFNVSANTVKNLVQKDVHTAQLCMQKKEENTKNVLDCMQENGQQACEFIKGVLKELSGEKRIKETSTAALATAFGIVADKYLKLAEVNGESKEQKSVQIEFLSDESNSEV